MRNANSFSAALRDVRWMYRLLSFNMELGMRSIVYFGLLLVAGCASTKNARYRPRKSLEKEAFARQLAGRVWV